MLTKIIHKRIDKLFQTIEKMDGKYLGTETLDKKTYDVFLKNNIKTQ